MQTSICSANPGPEPEQLRPSSPPAYVVIVCNEVTVFPGRCTSDYFVKLQKQLTILDLIKLSGHIDSYGIFLYRWQGCTAICWQIAA